MLAGGGVKFEVGDQPWIREQLGGAPLGSALHDLVSGDQAGDQGNDQDQYGQKNATTLVAGKGLYAHTVSIIGRLSGRAGNMTLENMIRRIAGKLDHAGVFFGHGTDNALDEACWLVTAALDRDPAIQDRDLGLELDAGQIEAVEALLARRIETRKPLAYLVGHAWLAGLKFEINEHVLVPRSPLAELIVEGFEPWLQPDQLQRAADVGAGSGCLAIALAHYWPEVRVDALDISEPALELARRNVRVHGLKDRVECLQSDLLGAVAGRSYDLILANPPYVPTASMEHLPAEFRHEPRLGLEAGPDGLDLVRRLLVQVPEVLSDHGVLICEVGEAAEAMDALLGGHVELVWLEFARGGDGVFLLDAPACQMAARTLVAGAIE